MDKWHLIGTNFTPDKTDVKVTSSSISVKNKGCKGKIKRREQCDNCAKKGLYQAGIFAFFACCNREDGWRKLEGKTDKECVYYTILEDMK